MGVFALIALLCLIGCNDDERVSGREQRINPTTTISNPFEGDEIARAEGERLYQQYNCVSCHGGAGAGGIGPTLNDARFRYGGSPAEIYQSIYEGRPEGMPVWGGQIPDEQIWKLVAYISSLQKVDVRTVTWPDIPAQAGRTTPAR